MSDTGARALERLADADPSAETRAKVARSRCREGQCCAHADPGSFSMDAWGVLAKPARGRPWIVPETLRRSRGQVMQAIPVVLGIPWRDLRARGWRVVKVRFQWPGEA